ncbi:MAG: HlyD family secretion protein [Verrucomicrobia bacterium]|nr:MAG: HlyD family secretion protein [Verrucomicrobiota bacterium]
MPPSADPVTSQKKQPVFPFLRWLTLLLLVAALAFNFRPKPLPVETAAAFEGPMDASVLEEGKTRIRNRYVISPPLAGMVRRTPLRAGDLVVQGQTLVAVIDPEPSELLSPRSRAQAEARVQSAEAALQQREADVARAASAADLASRERARADVLSRSGAISEQERDAAELGASMRNREWKAAEFSRDISRYELAQAQATLRSGPLGSAPLEITSPINGVVLNVFEENARSVAPGTPLLEVGDPSELEIEIELLSTDAAGVHLGAPVSIERWGGPDPLPAKVRLVEPAAFTKTSALGVEEQRVRVLVDFNATLPLSPKLGDRFRVEGRIQTWHSNRVLQVPAGALFRRGVVWKCFTLSGGAARLQELKVGHQNGQTAEILSGLAAGEAVIVHPPDAVREGLRVQARPSEP